MESGEDGIYNLITENKNMIFQPKVTITKKDVEEIPVLRELREHISHWDSMSKYASGYAAFLIKRTLIEMRKDQYIIKNTFKPPIVFKKLTRSRPKPIELPWNEWMDSNGKVCYSGISFLDPNVISLILQYYNKLKEGSRSKFDGDTWYLIQDFTALMERALEPYPEYQRFVELKFDGYQNNEIKEILHEEFGFSHTLEYVSNIWRKKIPKIISQ